MLMLEYRELGEWRLWNFTVASTIFQRIDDLGQIGTRLVENVQLVS